MMDAKAISVAVRAMQLHREDAKIQASAFSFLNSLLFPVDPDDDYYGWFNDWFNDLPNAGAIGLIVCYMKHHRLVADIQATGCDVLRRLARGDGRTQIVQANGIAVVLDAMQQHESDVKVQTSACQALWQLACLNAKHQELIADAGGISAIVGAMQRHESNANFQATACETLGVFSKLNAERQEPFAGGVSAILVAYRVQMRACWALLDLIHGWKKNELMTRKVRESLTRTLRNFPDLYAAKWLQKEMQAVVVSR